jgi:hypothetical protein
MPQGTVISKFVSHSYVTNQTRHLPEGEISLIRRVVAALREKRRLRVFETGVLKLVLEPRRVEATGEW